jgi:hypothetical protein
VFAAPSKADSRSLGSFRGLFWTIKHLVQNESLLFPIHDDCIQMSLPPQVSSLYRCLVPLRRILPELLEIQPANVIRQFFDLLRCKCDPSIPSHFIDCFWIVHGQMPVVEPPSTPVRLKLSLISLLSYLSQRNSSGRSPCCLYVLSWSKCHCTE